MLRGRGTSLLEITTCNYTDISSHCSRNKTLELSEEEEEAKAKQKELRDRTRFHLHVFFLVQNFVRRRIFISGKCNEQQNERMDATLCWKTGNGDGKALLTKRALEELEVCDCATMQETRRLEVSSSIPFCSCCFCDLHRWFDFLLFYQFKKDFCTPVKIRLRVLSLDHSLRWGIEPSACEITQITWTINDFLFLF